MRMILGITLFWISIIGYLLFFKKKTKLPYELLLPITFSMLGVIMFLAGILNIMKEATLLICFTGIILFTYKIIKKQFNFKELLNINFFIYLIAFVYITLICNRMQLLQYDNFSHWGLIAKNIFLNNRLPNFEDTVILFKTYQPGSACFIYYLGALCNKSEQSMIIAQNYMLIAYLFSLFAFTNKNKNNYILNILLISFYIFILFGNVKFNELQVDTLLAVMSINSLAIIYYFKDNLKKAFVYNLPTIIFIFLIKNTGIVLVGFSCLAFIYLGIRNKQIKKSILYTVLTFTITLSFFYIWTKHVSLVYGTSGLTAKHSLTINNIMSELSNKGIENIIEFSKIYIKNFFNITNNLSNKYIIGINTILILLILIFKNARKNFITCLIISNIIYFIYYSILGIMYILSMPWNEAIVLASFDRYMLTIIFVIIGLLLLFFINYVITDTNLTKKHILVSLCCSFILLFITFKYKVDNLKMFWGDLDYEKSIAYKFDQALGTRNFNAKNDEFFYIFTNNSIPKGSGYVSFLTRYKLNSTNFEFVYDIKDFEPATKDSFKQKIIVLDNNENINEYLKENGYKLFNVFYEKET